MSRRRPVSREWVAGVNAVAEALAAAPELALDLWVARERDDARASSLIHEALAQGLAVQRPARQRLDHLLDGDHHQGVALRRRARHGLALEALLGAVAASSQVLVLALDGVEDPHNVGACLRTAAAAGAAALVLPRSRGAPLNATVQRVASGAAERLPVVAVSNLSRALGRLAEADFQVIGLDGAGDEDLFALDLSGRTVLVAGAEHDGLRRLTRKACSALAAIPMAAATDSLNVSVAAGIALFAARQAQLGKR